MGAIIGAGIACGMSSSEIHDFVKNEMRLLKLVDFSFAGDGLVKWKRIVNSFDKIYEGKTISEAKIPLKIVATRLSDMEKIVFKPEDSIAQSVRASISIPWVFAPHRIDGEDYIDGYPVDNLPIVDLEGSNVLAISAAMDLTGPAKKVRDIITKSIIKMIADNEERSISESSKDVRLIRPKFNHIQSSDMHKFEEIIAIWYAETARILDTYE